MKTVTKRSRRTKPDPELVKLADSLLTNHKKPEDLIGENGLLKQLTKMLVERALEAEMTRTPGWEIGLSRTQSPIQCNLHVVGHALDERGFILRDAVRNQDIRDGYVWAVADVFTREAPAIEVGRGGCRRVRLPFGRLERRKLTVAWSEKGKRFTRDLYSHRACRTDQRY